jgi:dTDP-4-dehydrorhamnose reductase
VSRVLILGSSGMLGHKVYNYLKKNSSFDLANFSGSRKLNSETILLNARNEKKFINSIHLSRPDYIVNCIGALIKGSNANPEQAIFLNSYLPLMLERVSDSIGAKLIHISTDCVFSGDKKTPYVENDIKDGRGLYAITKSLGELIGVNSLTLRTSIIGPELNSNGEGLFNWFMSQSGSINGFTKMIWSGVTTLELSKAIKWAIDHEINGIYHITNNQTINKNELLGLFKVHTNKLIDINPVEENNIDKSFIDSRKLINYEIPSYDEMVREMVFDITQSKGLYSHYRL